MRITEQDLRDLLGDVLHAAGARGPETRPAVYYSRRRVRVHMTGGPDTAVVEQALRPLVDDRRLDSVTVVREDRWTCGAVHDSATHAWAAHEGSQSLRLATPGGCHGAEHYVLTVEDLVDLVTNGETFRSETCQLVPFTPAPGH